MVCAGFATATLIILEAIPNDNTLNCLTNVQITITSEFIGLAMLITDLSPAPSRLCGLAVPGNLVLFARFLLLSVPPITKVIFNILFILYFNTQQYYFIYLRQDLQKYVYYWKDQKRPWVFLS